MEKIMRKSRYQLERKDSREGTSTRDNNRDQIFCCSSIEEIAINIV